MSKFESNITFFQMAMAVHVLKTFSSKDNPMTLAEIQDKFQYISSSIKRRATFEANFQETVRILNSSSKTDFEKNLTSTFIASFLGTIGIYKKGEFRNPNTLVKVNRELYYFIPIMDHVDVDLLTGTVTTNPYLTEDEKSYLETRIEGLSGYDEMYCKKQDDSENKGAKRKNQLTKNQSFDPMNISAINEDRFTGNKKSMSIHILDIANAIRKAIQERKKISITYGSYGYDATKRDHLKLIPNKNEYILDPYALCWNNGFYYLICMNSKYENVSHFRVDRILSVTILPKKRAALPDILKPYFKGRGKTLSFDALLYKNQHPLMSVHAVSNPIRLTLETPALALICDYFGKDITIAKTAKTHINMNNVPLPVYKAIIENVEYSSALLFAQQQHEIVTVISPKELADDVKKMLKKSLDRLS